MEKAEVRGRVPPGQRRGEALRYGERDGGGLPPKATEDKGIAEGRRSEGGRRREGGAEAEPRRLARRNAAHQQQRGCGVGPAGRRGVY